MLDLRDDGTIGIDFEDGQPTVVLARPKFGAFKRIRAESQKRVDGLNAYLTEMREQEPKLENAEINERFAERSVDDTISWWELFLIGDDTFKSLVIEGTVPPVDDWPAYMIYGQIPGSTVANPVTMTTVILSHWRRVPLAHGGKPETVETPTE